MVKITPAVLDLLRERHVFSQHSLEQRWRVGDDLHFAPGTALEPYVHIFGGNVLPSAMGAFSYAQGRLLPKFRIGRYCSIADGLTLMGNAHPTDWAMTSPIFFDKMPLPGLPAYLTRESESFTFGIKKYDAIPPMVHIGNDVWTGMGIKVKGGVTIGDGAVIGAGSVVTRDVPPYAIVGGAPARLIRMRFEPEIVARFLSLQPWRFGPDDLQPFNVKHPVAFLDSLEAKIAAGEIAPMKFDLLTDADLNAAAAQAN